MTLIRSLSSVLAVFSFLFCTFFTTGLSAQSEPFVIYSEEANAEPGQVFCIDFGVNNFDSIVAILMSINFDASLLEFEAVNTSGSLAGIVSITNTTDCELTGTWAPPHCTGDAGFLNFLWQSSDFIVGNTLMDSTVLFEVCFRVKDSAIPGQSAAININRYGGSSNSEIIEVLNYVPEALENIEANGSEILIVPPASAILTVDELKVCPSDFSTSSGEVTFVVYGGTPPYTVNDITNGTTQTINQSGDIFTVNNLPSGLHGFQFFDATGAQVPREITIGLGSNIVLDSSFIRPTCDDRSNGRINLSATGGSPFSNGYLFEWSNSLIEFENQSSLTNLSNGMFSVTVTDSLGCSIDADISLITEPLSFSLNTTPPFCSTDLGTIELTASGGTGNYVANLYTGFGPNGFSGQSGPIQNFASTAQWDRESGTYYILLRNRDNSTGQVVDDCMYIDSVTFDSQNSVTMTSTIIATDCSNSTADYELTFTNSDGSQSDSFQIQVFDLDGPSLYTTASTGSGSSITLSGVPFNTEGYEIEGLSSDNCMFLDTLPSLAATGVLTIESGPDISEPCAGTSDGSIGFQVSSGSDVTFAWSTGQTFNDGNMTNIIADLDTGTYMVTISNADGCSLVETVELNGIVLNITSAANNSIDCNDSMGNITAEVSGGTGPYSFVWDHPNNDNTATLSNIAGGNSYDVVVTDANGCSSSQSLTLNSANAITLSMANTTAPTCHTEANGTAEVIATGGEVNTGSYTYTWSDGTIETVGTSSFTFNLSEGTQWVLASDGICTSDTQFFEISEGTRYQVDLSTSTITPPACEGDQNGFLFIEVTPNIPTTYTFSFPDLNIFNSPSPSQNGLGTGDIRVIIEDSNGCSNEDVVTISAANPIIASVDSIASVLPICADDDDLATLVIDAAGGNGPLMYNWDNANSTTNTASDLGIGTYAVTITDQNGCTSEITDIVVDRFEPIDATINTLDPACFGDQGGIVISDVTGGSGINYTYQINIEPVLSITDTGTVFPGTYNVVVYDSEGCSFARERTIASGNEISLDLVADPPNIELGGSSEIRAQIFTNTPLTGDVIWTPTDNLEFISNNDSEVRVTPPSDITYEAFVTDENGCTATDEVLITVSRSVGIYVPNVFNSDETSINRGMRVYAGAGVQVINSIKIYDRWGSLVNQVNNIQPDNTAGSLVWNGEMRNGNASTNNDVLNSGVYAYLLEYTLIDGTPGRLSGDVTLLR